VSESCWGAGQTNLLERYKPTDRLKCWKCSEWVRLSRWLIRDELALCPICWQVCSVERLAEVSEKEGLKPR
jgi:hypothetical protein